MNAIGTADVDWSNLGFRYRRTKSRFQAVYENGAWREEGLIEDSDFHLNESSPALHYAQQCFEGLKAQHTPDGRVLLFRPDLNCERLEISAERLRMPKVPREIFQKAVRETVLDNIAWVPPYPSEGGLYIRPLLIGVGENLGVNAAKNYVFRVFVCPVSSLTKETIQLYVCNEHRAAPDGIGFAKAGANYAATIKARAQLMEKHQPGCELLYLDAREDKYVEETTTSNLVVLYKDGRIKVPDPQNSVLKGITQRSILELASIEFGLETEKCRIPLCDDLDQFQEVGVCGTATLLARVSHIHGCGRDHALPAVAREDSVMVKLANALSSLQRGEREDRLGWTQEVERYGL